MDRVPKTINVIPNIFIFLSLITIFDNIATNVSRLENVATSQNQTNTNIEKTLN